MYEECTTEYCPLNHLDPIYTDITQNIAPDVTSTSTNTDNITIKSTSVSSNNFKTDTNTQSSIIVPTDISISTPNTQTVTTNLNDTVSQSKPLRKKIIKKDLSTELKFRLIKILDMGYVTCLYFIFGLYTALLFDRVTGDFNPEDYKNKSIKQCVLEIILQIWMNGVCIYIARNLVPLIPFPLDGIYGFEHKKLKELLSGGTYASALMMFQSCLNAKIRYTITRLNDLFD